MNSTIIHGQMGFEIVLHDIIRVHLFSKVKFVRKLTDVMFITNQKSICASVCRWLNITKLQTESNAKLWHKNINHIARYIQIHQNNVLEKLKNIAESKYTQLIEFIMQLLIMCKS